MLPNRTSQTVKMKGTMMTSLTRLLGSRPYSSYRQRHKQRQSSSLKKPWNHRILAKRLWAHHIVPTRLPRQDRQRKWRWTPLRKVVQLIHPKIWVQIPPKICSDRLHPKTFWERSKKARRESPRLPRKEVSRAQFRTLILKAVSQARSNNTQTKDLASRIQCISLSKHQVPK